MINALPSSDSSKSSLTKLPDVPKVDDDKAMPVDETSVTSTAAPVITPVESSQVTIMPPVGLPGIQTKQAPAVEPSTVKPHQSIDSLSESLAKKIQGEDKASTSQTTPPTTIALDASITAPSAGYSKPNGFKSKTKTLLAALVLGLITVGAGAGYYLSQQNQDVRQQAASEEVTRTESSRTPTDWGVFNQQWSSLLKNPENDWVEYVLQSQEGGARYKCDAEIMKVGEETLYGCDLNALFILYEPEKYISPGPISPQDPQLNAVLDGMITNSGLLQEAQKRGLITLDESFYNSPAKDPVKRIDTLRELRKQIGNTFNKTVDYEAIAIYFHNQVDPKIPLDQAQAAAKAKMDTLYARLQAGEITMQEAGAEIAADAITGDTTNVSLKDLDSLYAENAYSKRVEHVFDGRFFRDETLDEELRSLGEDQMSTVRLCKDFKFTDEELLAKEQAGEVPNFPLVDSCYIIFKLDKINFGWLDESADSASGEEYIQKTYSAQTTKKAENLQQ